MIINVGGRTDIVNYYTPWLINRLKEGFVYTRNPYHPKQLIKYDLSRKKVDAIIFCSKNYKPILKHMPTINNKYHIYGKFLTIPLKVLFYHFLLIQLFQAYFYKPSYTYLQS